MDLAKRLAEERRARLAAERLLELKQAELYEANRRLGRHALKLTQQIKVTKTEVEEIRDANARMETELGEVTNKFEEVSDQLWVALESIQDGFCMFGPDHRIELANSSYLSVFDGLETVGPGTSYHDVMAIMAEEGIVDLQGEPPQNWQDRMCRRWGSASLPEVTIRLYNGRFIKMRDRRMPNGGTVSLAVDITNLMRMWAAVQELPDGFVMYDSDDRLLMANSKYKEIYKVSAPAMKTGATFEDILRYGLTQGQYTEAVGREEEWLEERLEAHRDANKELEQELEDGRWLRVFERETSDGGRVGLRIDITDIKKDQARLQEAMIRAEEANRAKSAFLANMSHEIRTPMNGVVGMADLMMDTSLSEEQQLYVETIRSSGEALLVIINDILDYSKIDADKLQLHSDPFDLERTIHEVVMLLQPSARGKNVALLVDFDMFLPTRFVGDVGRIRQILTNILGNAVKFTNEGYVMMRIVGVCEEDGQTALHISIEDTGIGIPPEKIDHIFGEFNQVEDERNRKFEGTGLGLAISRKLVELMGGEIWVESEVDKGSCFGMRFVLPADEPIHYESAKIPQHLKTVLVVDDHSANRMVLSKQLAILGLQTDYCTSGQDTLDRVGPMPELIVIEQNLPDMTGQELVLKLREKGIDVPVILQSDSPGKLDALPGAEVSAVLQKPAPRRQLFDALEAIAPQGQTTTPEQDEETAEPEAALLPHTDTLDILVAEDNKTNQLVFKKMAASFDVDLRFANNGFEAVEAYETRRPDIIFMDISMPGMDGKQATQKIREIEAGGYNVPIIAVTAHAMEGDKEGILEAGLTDYMTKPLRKAALSDKLDQYRPQALEHRKAS
jgi:signal transduction histidine kinase/DNA-binding response OmpR family regulator